MKSSTVNKESMRTHKKMDWKSLSKVPWWGWVSAVLCILIPIVSLGGALPVLIGVGAAVSSMRVSVNPNMKLWKKVLACYGIVLLAWLMLGVVVYATGVLMSN